MPLGISRLIYGLLMAGLICLSPGCRPDNGSPQPAGPTPADNTPADAASRSNESESDSGRRPQVAPELNSAAASKAPALESPLPSQGNLFEAEADAEVPADNSSAADRDDPSNLATDGGTRRPRGERSLSDLLLQLENDDEPALIDGDGPDGSTAGQRGPLATVGDSNRPAVQATIDDAKVLNFGIRKLAGRHLTLYTDVPSSPEVDELPTVLDAAISEWTTYFDLAPDQLAEWKLTGFLMKDKERFVALDLVPAGLPPFLNGYQSGNQIWFYEQPTAYYRRHLMLHEATHAIMHHLYGSAGPPWYMEGMAELLGTHRWDTSRPKGSQLTLNYFPQHPLETPHWGRIKIVQEDFAANRGMSLPAILLYPHTAHLKVEPYGWCWAACAFLDGHPEYRQSFRALRTDVQRGDFNQQFFETNQERWWQIELQWQLFAARLEYGYDIVAEAVQFQPGEPIRESEPRTVQTAVDRGWQSTGIQVQAGRPYRLESEGRYQIATEEDGRIWWSEPSGVTLQYYGGHPLGTTLAAIHPDGEPPRVLTMLVHPLPVGLVRTVVPPVSGTLYLRANDSPTTMGDNRGSFQTRVTAIPQAEALTPSGD